MKNIQAQEYTNNRKRLLAKIKRGGNSITDYIQWERFVMEGDEFIDFYEIVELLADFGEDVVVLYDHHIRLAAATAIQLPARNCIIKMRAEKSFLDTEIVFGEMVVVWYTDEVSDTILGNFVDESAVLRWLA